jgi:DNA polymerase gamma 1
VKQAQVPHYQAQVATSELKKFGLDSSGSSFPLPDITPHLPPILNNNVSDHFWQVASEQVQPYTDLLLDLLASDTPPTPAKWNLEPGWTRYNASDGTWASVPYPTEKCCVFDVEVCVIEDPRAVMAIAVTSEAWYSWLSPHLVHAESFPSTMSPCSMIPMGSDESPCLVVGHNVAYDRVRVGDEYRIDRSGTRYLDTMSMHIAVAGMTSSQRMMKLASKKMTKEELKHKPMWLNNTSMNGLADVHKFYCKTTDSLDKDPRNSFVKLGLSELMADCPNLLSYCAGDVTATLDVLRILFPLYSEQCPHPATLSGMLTMSTSFLPTNNCWENFITTADETYKTLEKEMMKLVETEAELAIMMIMDCSYKHDPWLWDLEWKIASKKTIKARRMKLIHEKKIDIEQLFESGYPTWYQDLADEDEGRAFLNLSTGKRVVPKLLRLTWKGYPLHHDKVEKWGFLIPSADVEEIIERIDYGEIESDFPLEEFLAVVNKDNPMNTGHALEDDMDEEPYIEEISEYEEEKLKAKEVKRKLSKTAKTLEAELTLESLE